jgi:hypothetical protein
MTNPIGRFVNTQTGEVVDRELTDAEYNELLNPVFPDPFAEKSKLIVPAE